MTSTRGNKRGGGERADRTAKRQTLRGAQDTYGRQYQRSSVDRRPPASRNPIFYTGGATRGVTAREAPRITSRDEENGRDLGDGEGGEEMDGGSEGEEEKDEDGRDMEGEEDGEGDGNSADSGGEGDGNLLRQGEMWLGAAQVNFQQKLHTLSLGEVCIPERGVRRNGVYYFERYVVQARGGGDLEDQADQQGQDHEDRDEQGLTRPCPQVTYAHTLGVRGVVSRAK